MANHIPYILTAGFGFTGEELIPTLGFLGEGIPDVDGGGGETSQNFVRRNRKRKELAAAKFAHKKFLQVFRRR